MTDRTQAQEALEFCRMVEEIGMPDNTVIPVWPVETEMAILYPLTVGMVKQFRQALERPQVDVEGLKLDPKDIEGVEEVWRGYDKGWNDCVDNLNEQGYLSQPDKEAIRKLELFDEMVEALVIFNDFMARRWSCETYNELKKLSQSCLEDAVNVLSEDSLREISKALNKARGE